MLCKILAWKEQGLDHGSKDGLALQMMDLGSRLTFHYLIFPRGFNQHTH
jgi:hypothetical protein